MAKKPGLMKKYIAMAKRGAGTTKTLFKRAWALQKRKAKGPAKKTTIKKTTTTGGRPMAAKKKPATKTVVRYRTKPAPKAAPRKKQKISWMRNKYVNAGMNVTVTSMSAIAGTIAMNKTPKIMDLKNWQKGLIQGGAGIALSFLNKNLWWKKATLGVAGGGVITAVLPWLSEKGFTPWGGPGNQRLTPYQKARVANSNGNGNSVRNNRTGCAGPIDHMAGPVDNMGGPVDRMGGPPMYRGNTFQSVQNPTAY